MPWEQYTPAEIAAFTPSTTLSDVILTPFNAAVVPAGRKVCITDIQVTRKVTATATITLRKVKSDGSQFAIFEALELGPSGQTSILQRSGIIVLEPGDKLVASQGTAGAINVIISGSVVT